MANQRLARSDWYNAARFFPRVSNMISERDMDRHKHQRRFTRPVFPGREIAASVDEKLAAHRATLLGIIDDHIASQTAFDLAQLIIRFSYALISDIVLDQVRQNLA